ncbi:APC family permease [Bacillus sp. HMF5848]|uniref:APC family permease n=1 Tax=Bacillus sp. HMF5848 TaxID=2495421 RepID=UPI000F78F52B|nr:APC family permease [Bacillus sp. HMF5848]RSK26616.1 APC family permease [Bacillus sp. HMF5848]
MSKYNRNSITLFGAVGLGTGVMISAGIFALLGQVAELAGYWFPVIFIIGGIVTAFSSYSYIKMSQEFPSAGGIGMFLVKAYGKSTVTASAAIFMAASMILNQSLVARTFGTYTLQLFNTEQGDYLVPILGVGLLIFAFIVNVSGNTFIQSFTSIISLLKVAGLVIFAFIALWITGFELELAPSSNASNLSISSYIAAVALTILSFKGFTTITNSGAEIVKPTKNIGRAIIISIMISLFVYILLAWAVSSNLSISQIIQAKDYALAEAARPVLGQYGVWFTAILAIIATISGIIASIFAVSRMLAMLTEMELIPHKHFGMPGHVQTHTLIYTTVVAIILTILFDLTRIASMGAILYLVMDIIIHWGVLKHLRKKVDANPIIILLAIMFDSIVLLAFIWVKVKTDVLIVFVSTGAILFIFLLEHLFLKNISKSN